MGKVLEMVREEAGEVFLGIVGRTLQGGNPEDAIVDTFAKRAGHHARRGVSNLAHGNSTNGVRALVADASVLVAGFLAEEVIRRGVPALRGRNQQRPAA